MDTNTIIGIVGAVVFGGGIITYLKTKNNRIKLASFIAVMAGIILIAISIVGLPTQAAGAIPL